MRDKKKSNERRSEEKLPINLNLDRKTPNYSGYIIIRVTPTHTSSKSDDLRKEVKNKLPGLAAFLNQHDRISMRRLIHSVSIDRLREMEEKARASEFAPINSLTNYWRLDCRTLDKRTQEVVEEMQKLPGVELAYMEEAVLDPVVNDADDPFAETQDYLDAAEVGGFDARWAWTQANGEGAGVGFVDLEQGWFLAHEDLVAKAPTLIFNDNRDGVDGYRGDHGTAVLGEVIAVDNMVGVVGAAPTVSSVRVVSHYEAATNTALHVADAIVAAINVMAPGDVLLLEVQRSLLPTETDGADFDAIRLATASGIIVVEAAGNGNSDLDAWVDPGGLQRLNRSSADFRDSGAIMTGSCTSALPHNRYVGCGAGCGSNFGSRIDCFGWGENITTAGYGDLDPGTGNNSTYTSTFGGTSGASPMIVGAALIVQGMYQAASPSGGRLSPSQMRALLSDPDTGTPQGPDVAGNIGVMPNLRAIIEETLGLSPDLYLRDAVGDSGVVPSTGAISASPDIIVRPALEADPNASFGEGSGNEDSSSLGFQVEAGQDNFIYVRMRNRSNVAAADNATATVYWSEPSTLVTPDLWNLIGTTPPVDVPAGDTLVVAGPITWAAADIPAEGHYCFVGILNQARDLAPLVPPSTDWDGFTAFIRNNNNVTWRNFNVIDDVADPSIQSFIVAGAPDRSRVFDLEVLQRLPRNAQAILEMPVQLFAGLPRNAFLGVKIDRKEQYVRVSLAHLRRLELSNVRLRKGARHRCRLIVTGLKGNQALGHSVAIRQLYEGQEVGRITWVFRHRSEREDYRPRVQKRTESK